MRRLHQPALLPAVAALAGAAFAIRSGLREQLPALLLLLALGLVLAVSFRRRSGWWTVFLALGALSGALRNPPAEAPRVDPSRPVEATLTLLSPWREGLYGWSALAQTKELRQGETSVREPRQVWLQLSGEDLPPPAAGTLRVRGYLTRRQAFRNDPLIPAGPWRLSVKSRRLVEEVSRPGVVLGLSRALRHRVEEALKEVSPGDLPPALGLLRALLLGDSRQLDRTTVRALRRCGLGHLLAVSGLHTAWVLLLAAVVGRLLPRVLRLPFSLLILALFVLLVGPRPSILRAAAMALLGFGALRLGRLPQALNALACYVLASVLLDPQVVTDLGFQLSVAATAGILLVTPWLAGSWSLPRWLALPLAASAGAQVATLPFALPAFSVLHPLAPFFNLLALPWSGLFLGVGILWLLGAILAPGWARALLPLLELLALPAEALTHLPPHPLFTLPWVAGTGLAAVGALGMLAGFRWPGRIGGPLLLGVVLGSLLLAPPREPELVLFDVGQGEAILLRSAGRNVLIDGGGSPGGGIGDRILVPSLARLGVRELHSVVVTHPDLDHCAGLVELADYLPMREVRSSRRWRSSDCVAALERRRGIPWRGLAAGDVRGVGEWRLEVLHPPEPAPAWGDNDSSLVVIASSRGVRILLTGDLEATGERHLLAEHRRDLPADVLKVAHHGSRSSTGGTFLRTVNPRLALISAGLGNRFGHPHGTVLARLEGRGIRVLRTDVRGSIRLVVGPAGELRYRSPGVSYTLAP